MRLLFTICMVLSTLALSTAQSIDPLPTYPANSPNYLKFTAEQPPLIPIPQDSQWGNKALPLNQVSLNIPIKISGKVDKKALFMRDQLIQFLKTQGVGINKDAYKIIFRTSQDAFFKEHPEGYTLSVTPRGTLITALDDKGFYYASQTLQQLIIKRNGKTTIAQAEIKDYPSLKLRGFMHDLGRNYLSIPLILEQIDALARYKYNVYHFHCTDNYGWRLESKKHPQVNDPKSFERKPGKIYTQKEVQQLIEYCRLRNITLIPELDMPGHTKSFRKALDIKSMEDPKATKVLTDLIKELCSLAPPEVMPYIHIGTDEARAQDEKISDKTLKSYYDTIESENRRGIRWQQGMGVKGDKKTIQQMWAERKLFQPWDGVDYIDSQENYLNHLDPFEVPMTFYFRKPCPHTNANGIGSTLCSWPDLFIENERDHLSHNPVYPAILVHSEAAWSNKRTEDIRQFYFNLPTQDDKHLEGFREFEDRFVAHRDRFFRDKEFPYVRQTDFKWKLLGPIPNHGKTDAPMAPETGSLQANYNIDGKEYKWDDKEYTGGTIIFKHYCDGPGIFNNGVGGSFPHPEHTYFAATSIYSPKAQSVPFWISGHTWPTSDWRMGAVSVPGKWFHADTKFWVNGELIPPPQWEEPNRKTGDTTIPQKDENYHFRKPTMVNLKQGWNKVLVKIPHNKQTRRWMFTFAPLMQDSEELNVNVREFPGLIYSPSEKK